MGVAYKPLAEENELVKDDETDMRFLGFITLFDPPKANCAQTIEQLRQLGVTLKIITGDNRLVAETVSQQLGLSGCKNPDRSGNRANERKRADESGG